MNTISTIREDIDYPISEIIQNFDDVYVLTSDIKLSCGEVINSSTLVMRKFVGGHAKVYIPYVKKDSCIDLSKLPNWSEVEISVRRLFKNEKNYFICQYNDLIDGEIKVLQRMKKTIITD